MKLKFFCSLVAIAFAAMLAAPAQAQLTPYSQDFEGLDPADPDALSNDGWLVFGNVFDPTGTIYFYGYGPFPAPNPGVCPDPTDPGPCPAFSAVVTGEGGPDQGAQQLSVYSDYNNADHGNGFRIESNVFQEQIVGPGDVGQTWVFSFDAKRGDIGGSTGAVAFIKTLDPNAGFALTNFLTVDTANLPDTWGSYEIPITIDSSLPGQILQIGFLSNASNFEPSGVFYDNVNFAEFVPQLIPYSQDFENLDQADPEALGNNGWLVFANVFDPSGTIYFYGYGPFPAPNPGVCPDPNDPGPCPAFSAIVIGEGGPDQGAQQLNVYSDYNNGDHANGFLIESNVFQEQIVPAANVGQTWVFTFDAKRGDIGGSSTAAAFIKTIDPGAGFALTNFLTVDTTNLPDMWGTYEISIEIDPSLPGQILQFGFLSNASNFEPSGVFYDNVDFAQAPPIPCEPDPATQGYWHRQCLGVPESEGGIDPGRFGRGPGAPTEPGFVDELMPCAFELLEAAGLFGLMTCDGMDADPASDPCQRAEKQFTALILNVCSGRVQDTCSVDLSAQGCLSTDLDSLIVELGGYIQAGSCQLAAECASTLNEGFGLVDGGDNGLAEPAAAREWRIDRTGRRKIGR